MLPITRRFELESGEEGYEEKKKCTQSKLIDRIVLVLRIEVMIGNGPDEVIAGESSTIARCGSRKAKHTTKDWSEDDDDDDDDNDEGSRMSIQMQRKFFSIVHSNTWRKLKAMNILKL